MLDINGRDELLNHVGDDLGTTEWYLVDQKEIDQFAKVTGDLYWMHLDVARAEAAVGGTIAHGLYTLSLGPRFCYQMYEIHGFAQELNYGYSKVRFPEPLPVGCRVRMRARLDSVDERAEDRYLTTVSQVFERENAERPVCVAEALTLYIS